MLFYKKLTILKHYSLSQSLHKQAIRVGCDSQGMALSMLLDSALKLPFEISLSILIFWQNRLLLIIGILSYVGLFYFSTSAFTNYYLQFWHTINSGQGEIGAIMS